MSEKIIRNQRKSQKIREARNFVENKITYGVDSEFSTPGVAKIHYSHLISPISTHFFLITLMKSKNFDEIEKKCKRKDE